MWPDVVVCWLWTDLHFSGVRYKELHVRALRAMVAKHYPMPHRFVCATDQDIPGVETVRITELSEVRSPHGSRFPSCYRRLALFRPDAGEVFGGRRIVSLDLDVVIVGGLFRLWARPEPLVMVRDPHPACRYNASMMLIEAGSHPELWEEFDPETTPETTVATGRTNGSDQGWISYRVGAGLPTWGPEDGVYSYRHHLRGRGLPTDARVVSFHGRPKPWEAKARRDAWVRQSWVRAA